MIEQEQIDHIKSATDLKALVESKGIKLKKNGKGYFGLCPFHKDTNPSLSITPSKNEWHCFGCGKGGDVIRFIELFDQVDFKEAVKRLSSDYPATTAVKKKKPPTKPATKLTPEHIKLLIRVIEFYNSAFAEDDRAMQYLATRGITDKSIFSDYNVGFANGTLLNVLPDDKKIIKQLKEIGILNNKAHEHFYGCVTFPLYDTNGIPKGIYGRRIDDMAKGADHLYLPGDRQGIFNRQAVNSHKKIILTESIIDSLTLTNAGIKNTIPCYGTNGLTSAHINLLSKVEAVYICFDGDEAGKTALAVVQERLSNVRIKTYPMSLPEDQDINDFFLLTANAKQEFESLIAQADPGTSKAVKIKNRDRDQGQDKVIKTDYGFIMTIDNRKYELRGITKKNSKLKVTVKGIKDKNMHVDTVDFYSARSRAYLVKGLCNLFDKDEQVITRDVTKLLQQAEQHRESDQDKTPEQTMTDKDKAQAIKFLKSPDMFKEILRDFETLGYTGEEMNKLLCYVAAISRKMENPLSVMIQSRSAAGKSYLQDTVLSLVPKEDCTKYTRLTDQALFYTGSKALKHKILAIEELDGMNGAIYSIRSIQSSKEITIAYTGKDSVTGEQKTMENKVEGPLMVFITTTQVDIDGETASRFVFISIDESEEMTKKVLIKQRESHTKQGMLNKLKSNEITKKHHNANRLLKPLHVFNPYAELLTFTSRSLRARRDHTKYLNLILAIAYLFQYQKKTHTMEYNNKILEYINVTLDDIEKANTIANYVLGRSLDELSPPSRALLKLVQDMVKKRKEPYHFTRRAIREFSGWSDFQVKTHIKQLEGLEYLYTVMGKKGKEYVYELLVPDTPEDKPFLIGLTDIKQLKEKVNLEGKKSYLEG